MSINKAYEKKFEAQLNEWKTEIDKLKAKVEKAEADAQIKYHKQVEDIRAQQKIAQEKLAELKKAGEGASEDLGIGLDNALKNLRVAVESAISRFK